MTSGLEIRAQIDTETAKALLLVNGGGAVALIAFIPRIMGKPGYEAFTLGVLIALFIFQTGLLLAIAHNAFRRLCSLEYEKANYTPPRRPRVCVRSTYCKWGSLIAFTLGGMAVLIGGMISLFLM